MGSHEDIPVLNLDPSPERGDGWKYSRELLVNLRTLIPRRRKGSTLHARRKSKSKRGCVMNRDAPHCVISHTVDGETDGRWVLPRNETWEQMRTLERESSRWRGGDHEITLRIPVHPIPPPASGYEGTPDREPWGYDVLHTFIKDGIEHRIVLSRCEILHAIDGETVHRATPGSPALAWRRMRALERESARWRTGDHEVTLRFPVWPLLLRIVGIGECVDEMLANQGLSRATEPALASELEERLVEHLPASLAAILADDRGAGRSAAPLGGFLRG